MGRGGCVHLGSAVKEPVVHAAVPLVGKPLLGGATPLHGSPVRCHQPCLRRLDWSHRNQHVARLPNPRHPAPVGLLAIVT